MKKLMAMVLAMVFVLTMTVGVFAEEPAVKGKVIDPEKQALKEQVLQLTEQLKALNEQVKGLHEQVVAKHEIIKPLVVAAREAKDIEKLEAAKAIKEELRAINAEIQSIRETKEEVRLSIKAAREAKDFDTVIAGLTQLIEYKTQIISKINDKLVLLDEAIAALQ